MVISHVLISRPQPEAAELAILIKDTGLVPVISPAFAFEPGFAGLEFGKVWPKGKRHLVIFCSPRAVEFGLRQLPAGFLDDVEIAAIGPATANCMESAGHSVSIIPDAGFDSESLLAHPALLESPGKALIFAAPGGRQKIYSSLQERGWAVDFAHVYRAIPLPPEAGVMSSLQQSAGVLSIWTSENAMNHLSETISPGAWAEVCKGRFVVTSKRLAGKANSYAQDRVSVTDGPDNQAIMACILQLI